VRRAPPNHPGTNRAALRFARLPQEEPAFTGHALKISVLPTMNHLKSLISIHPFCPALVFGRNAFRLIDHHHVQLVFAPHQPQAELLLDSGCDIRAGCAGFGRWSSGPR
jgi:hypothetical protein